MALRLVPPVGPAIEIPDQGALVGRDPTANIVVNDPSVSRCHARIERRPEGWLVIDQRSANGTWIDNGRIEGAAWLQSGQQLRLGAVSFEVQVPGMPSARGPMTIPPQQAQSPYGQPAYQPPAAPAYAPPPPAHPSYPPQAPAYPPQAPGQPGAAPSYPPSMPPGYPQAPPGYPAQGGAPVYAPPGGGAPAAAGRGPAPPPPAAGGMTEPEAAEILGLWPGSPAEEVRRRYQKLFNDFQIRITNAPTPALKKMYQKNIQDLRTAADIISPGAVA